MDCDFLTIFKLFFTAFLSLWRVFMHFLAVLLDNYQSIAQVIRQFWPLTIPLIEICVLEVVLDMFWGFLALQRQFLTFFGHFSCFQCIILVILLVIWWFWIIFIIFTLIFLSIFVIQRIFRCACTKIEAKGSTFPKFILVSWHSMALVCHTVP